MGGELLGLVVFGIGGEGGGGVWVVFEFAMRWVDVVMVHVIVWSVLKYGMDLVRASTRFAQGYRYKW